MFKRDHRSIRQLDQAVRLVEQAITNHTASLQTLRTSVPDALSTASKANALITGHSAQIEALRENIAALAEEIAALRADLEDLRGEPVEPASLADDASEDARPGDALEGRPDSPAEEGAPPAEAVSFWTPDEVATYVRAP